METSGFYKNDDGMILHGPNFVKAGSFNIFREHKDEYTYPVGGWYWFDSKEEAYAFWNIQVPQEPELPYIPPIIPPIDPN